MFPVNRIREFVERKHSVVIYLTDGSVLYRTGVRAVVVQKIEPERRFKRTVKGGKTVEIVKEAKVILNGFRDTPLRIVETWTDNKIAKDVVVGYNLGIPVYPDNQQTWTSLQQPDHSAQASRVERLRYLKQQRRALQRA